MTEQQIQQQIRIACSRGPVRLWRNNVGALRDENGRPGGRATTEQLNWLATVREMGGIAGLVHSVEEADALLRAPPP
jgi:hypothetical protein